MNKSFDGNKFGTYPLYDSISLRLFPILSKILGGDQLRLHHSSRSQSARSQIIQYITVDTMSLDAIINCICSAEGSSKTASAWIFRTEGELGTVDLGKSTKAGFELRMVRRKTERTLLLLVVFVWFCSRGCKEQTEQRHFRPKQHRHYFLSLDDQPHSCKRILPMVVVDLLSS